MYLCHLQRWILLHGLFIPTDCWFVPYAKGNLMNCRWHGTNESLKSLPNSWNHTEKTVWKRSYAGWWLTYPSEKYESQWEGLSHILWKINMFQTTNQYKYWTQNENEWNLGFPGSTKFDPYDMFPKMNAVYSRCIWSSEASLNPSFFEEPKKHAINYRTRKT
jgi:hypothetical protein